MSTLSTHVLDTARGRPAEGMEVVLEARVGDGGGGRRGDASSPMTEGSEAVPLHARQASSPPIPLYPGASTDWRPLSSGETNADGRIPALLPGGMELSPGTYRLIFRTGAYHAAQQQPCFYPSVTVEFAIGEATDHYHVPLLLSPYGFSTYRGS